MNIKSKPVKALFSLFLLFMLHLPANVGAESKVAAGFHKVYLVQPGDMLRISVWKEQDLQREVLVQPDGRFAFPLVGELDTRGKSVSVITQEIRRRIAKFISDASVTVMLTQTSGNKVFMIGQLNRPGEYVMTRRVDVVQSLSMAGGLTPFAKSGNIKIIRRDESGAQKVFKFDFNDAKNGKKLGRNIVLQGGDVVIVP